MYYRDFFRFYKEFSLSKISLTYITFYIVYKPFTSKLSFYMILQFHQELKQLKSLAPSQWVNTLFGKLYEYCIHQENNLIKITPEIEDINDICANAEYELEIDFAKKIIQSDSPERTLYNFPYYQNYLHLVKLEYLNMSFFQPNISHILFLGSGPLPLSAIILAQRYHLHVTLVDHSRKALNISRKVIKKLNLEKNFDFICEDATTYSSQKKYDFVIGASLLFQTKWSENEILKHIKQNLSFPYLLLRSSDGFKQLLYRKIPKTTMKKHFDILLEIHPRNEIINSIFILKNYVI